MEQFLPEDLVAICESFIGRKREQKMQRVHDELLKRFMMGTFAVSQLANSFVLAIYLPRFLFFKRKRQYNRLLIVDI